AFAPFKVKVSHKRLKWLELDVHPVNVHLTEAFAAMTTILFFITLFIHELLGINFFTVHDFFVLLLPLFIMAGGATGLIDGKVRYRKLGTPYLKLKITMAIGLLVVSLVMLVVHFQNPERTDTVFLLLEMVLVLIAMLLAALLGWFGAKLVCPIVPRGTEIK
ncbi:MAG: hypothetical protein ACFFD4_33615, partial [Candidatus Odinarchaeota archaeon]